MRLCALQKKCGRNVLVCTTELKCFGSSLSCISLQILGWGLGGGLSRVWQQRLFTACVDGGGWGWHLGQCKRGLLMDVQRLLLGRR